MNIDVPPISIRKLNTMGSISYHKDPVTGLATDNPEPHISINKGLLLWWLRDDLEDTIRHELVHIKSNDYNHTSVFKECAKRYNVKIREQDT